jgi:hypothetical protein
LKNGLSHNKTEYRSDNTRGGFINIGC